MQRLAAQHDTEKEAIGLQRIADLNEGAGQIIDPVQREAGEHQIETVRAKRQRLGITDKAGTGKYI